jgi:hypothetical protein
MIGTEGDFEGGAMLIVNDQLFIEKSNRTDL